TITSSGERPERQESATADVFRVTLDPGAVITYVAELRTGKLSQIYLWEPDAYKDKVNSITLYYGIVIGIAGLLALFLTILFVVKGSVMFPAAAALGWAVLVYIGIDFGFWGKVFDMSAGAERVWRASGEAILAATLLVFLFAYLNLNRWHVRYAHITLGWLALLGCLVAVALFDASIASGIARLSLFAVAVLGFGLVIYLSLHGFDRAVLLIPTWLLLVVWVIAAGMAVTSYVTNDIVGPALLGGLVLIVMLIGFTVMQHAFAGGVTHGIVSDVERRALALTARPVVGSDGEVVRLVGTLTDVTEFKNAEERLLHDAVHDNLTGLPNRELFLDRLESVLALSKADPAIHPTALVVDLDRFKQVND